MLTNKVHNGTIIWFESLELWQETAESPATSSSERHPEVAPDDKRSLVPLSGAPPRNGKRQRPRYGIRESSLNQ